MIFRDDRSYKIRPCILPLLHPSMGSALRASLQLFKFDPVKFVGPAKGCSLKLMDTHERTLYVMARRARHKDVTCKFNPIEFSPAQKHTGMTNGSLCVLN